MFGVLVILVIAALSFRFSEIVSTNSENNSSAVCIDDKVLHTSGKYSLTKCCKINNCTVFEAPITLTRLVKFLSIAIILTALGNLSTTTRVSTCALTNLS